MCRPPRRLPWHAQDGSEVTWEQVASLAPAAPPQADGGGSSPPVSLRTQPWCGSYAVTSGAFQPALVGAKSLNTLSLKARPRPRLACSVGVYHNPDTNILVAVTTMQALAIAPAPELWAKTKLPRGNSWQRRHPLSVWTTQVLLLLS